MTGGSAEDGDGDFLSRWSRRKRAEPKLEDAPPKVPEPDPPAEDVAPEEETEAEALARLGLPDPESLGAGDDFTGFMKPGVPDMLRRRALRQLWRSNPVLANVDGLVDYGENFADPALIPDVIATAYKVGEGMIRKALETEEEAEEGTDETAEGEGAPVSEPEVEAPPPLVAVRPPEPVKVDPDAPPEPPSEAAARRADMAAVEDEAPVPPRPRRMRFET